MEQSDISLHKIALPLTTLSYARCGQGPPLVIVPATISRIRDWQPLIRFMGQKFTTLFFELPGHGGSTPFPQPFSSHLVGRTVEDLINALQFDSITLMGFSFGGILTLRILNRIQPRIKRLVLLSPCVSHHTLLYSPIRLMLLRVLVKNHAPALAAGFLLENDAQRGIGRLCAPNAKKMGPCRILWQRPPQYLIILAWIDPGCIDISNRRNSECGSHLGSRCT